jgi:hypothetical protein
VELIVRIGSDPTSWAVEDATSASAAEQLASGPVALPVTAPLSGTLVVSPRAAGSVALINPPGGKIWETHDWNPGHGQAPTAPLVYLPSPAGPGQGGLYAVSSNVNRDTVIQEIMAAMAGDGKMLTFPVYDASGTGVLVISGASLAFAVVC